MKKQAIFLALLLIFFNFNLLPKAYANSPIALLQNVADNMIKGLKANKANLKTKPEVVYSLAYRYVVPYAALAEMSKRVLPPHIWNSASNKERLQFQKLFTKTVMRTYASALTNYQDQTIRFFPIRGNINKNVEVNSIIESSNRQPIHVTYRLLATADGWRFYDMSVEGVSMLNSFRAQFADILNQGNMNTLLNRLSGHAGKH